MGLFVDMNPEEMMMGMDGNLDDPDLVAELAAITGKKAAAGGKARQKGKSECNSYNLQFCKHGPIISLCKGPTPPPHAPFYTCGRHS